MPLPVLIPCLGDMLPPDLENVCRGAARRGDSWEQSQGRHRSCCLLPGAAFCTPLPDPSGPVLPSPCADGQCHCPCTCVQHREGSPVQHRGAKVSPRQGKAGKCPHDRQWSSALYHAQPSHKGDGCRSAGTRTQEPQHSCQWLAWGPQHGQPGRAQPAAPHSC